MIGTNLYDLYSSESIFFRINKLSRKVAAHTAQSYILPSTNDYGNNGKHTVKNDKIKKQR